MAATKTTSTAKTTTRKRASRKTKETETPIVAVNETIESKENVIMNETPIVSATETTSQEIINTADVELAKTPTTAFTVAAEGSLDSIADTAASAIIGLYDANVTLPTFKTESLNEAALKIRNAAINTAVSVRGTVSEGIRVIAETVANVAESKDYEKDDFKTLEAWGAAIGFKSKSTVSKFATAGRVYADAKAGNEDAVILARLTPAVLGTIGKTLKDDDARKALVKDIREGKTETTQKALDNWQKARSGKADKAEVVKMVYYPVISKSKTGYNVCFNDDMASSQLAKSADDLPTYPMGTVKTAKNVYKTGKVTIDGTDYTRYTFIDDDNNGIVFYEKVDNRKQAKQDEKPVDMDRVRACYAFIQTLKAAGVTGGALDGILANSGFDADTVQLAVTMDCPETWQ